MKLSLGLSPRDYSVAGGAVAYDTDAQAYFTANTAITSSADKNAINDFYLGLKSDGIYTKIKAMYLPIWGSAASCKWNLVNPVDSNPAFRLTFHGTSWDYSSSGITPLNAYANTNFNPQSIITDTNNFSLSYYSRTNIDSGCDIGVFNGTTNSASQIFPKSIGIRYVRVFSSFTTESTSESTSAFYINSRLSSTTVKAYRNGSVLTTLSLSNLGNINYNIYIGARNNMNIADAYSTRQCSFASIGNGLTDTEATNFYNRVQTLMTYFGINV